MAIEKFSFPTAITFGPGARREVAAHLKQKGVKRPLIVTDKGLADLPILKDFAGSLEGLAVSVFAAYSAIP
jgi:alcohol dehydrogenase class IV